LTFAKRQEIAEVALQTQVMAKAASDVRAPRPAMPQQHLAAVEEQQLDLRRGPAGRTNGPSGPSSAPGRPTQCSPETTLSCYPRVMPNFALEKSVGGRVAGVDEVGRGPLAGPVVAAAVVFPTGVPRRLAAMLDDSKKLTAEQRLAAFAALRASRRAEIAIGAASVAEIHRLNILRAALLAMARAVSRLPAPPDLALVDGNQPPVLSCPVRCVIGGDALCLSIAAASIVAKVVRDRAMTRLAVRFPGYGWETNAGYATEFHRTALLQLGPTRHHRPGFSSVAQLVLALSG
jgi:ribonuclease HII